MGCDVHLTVERKVGDTWIPLKNETPEDYRDGMGEDTPYYYSYFNWYTGRHYQLFGHLAGVRAWDAIRIADPRGLPDDVSAPVKAASDAWDIDGHTHSWLTIAELKNFEHWDADCQYFLKHNVKLWAKLGPPNKVRIVFWFDN